MDVTHVRERLAGEAMQFYGRGHAGPGESVEAEAHARGLGQFLLDLPLDDPTLMLIAEKCTTDEALGEALMELRTSDTLIWSTSKDYREFLNEVLSAVEGRSS